MVVAKTLAAQTGAGASAPGAHGRRHYRALVQGALTAGGTVDAPIGRHPTQRTRMAVVGNGRPAVTRLPRHRAFPASPWSSVVWRPGVPPDPRPWRTSAMRWSAIRFMGATAAMFASDAFPRQPLHAFRLGLVHPRSGEAMI